MHRHVLATFIATVVLGAQVDVLFVARNLKPEGNLGVIRGLQRGYLGGRELATDFKHPGTDKPYNPDFAAMARSAGVEGVSVDRAADLAEAIRVGIATGKPYLIDANIGADLNPGGAGVWELPAHGQSKPTIGERYVPK